MAGYFLNRPCNIRLAKKFIMFFLYDVSSSTWENQLFQNSGNEPNACNDVRSVSVSVKRRKGCPGWHACLSPWGSEPAASASWATGVWSGVQFLKGPFLECHLTCATAAWTRLSQGPSVTQLGPADLQLLVFRWHSSQCGRKWRRDGHKSMIDSEASAQNFTMVISEINDLRWNYKSCFLEQGSPNHWKPHVQKIVKTLGRHSISQADLSSMIRKKIKWILP